MITAQQASQFVKRFSALRDFKSEPEAQRELILALQQSAQSIDHADVIVTQWLEFGRFAPTPADLYEVAARTRQPAPENACRQCDGTGFAQGYLEVTVDDQGQPHERAISHQEYRERLRGPGPRVYQQVRPCPACRAGKPQLVPQAPDGKAAGAGRD